MLKKIIFASLSAVVILTSTVYSNVKVAALFCDHMVLQQKSDAPIWGWALPNEQITIQPGWTQETATATTDNNGSWKTTIKTPTAGGPYTIKIKGSNEIIISDVLIGEVWICSGQSNMEASIGWLGTKRSKSDIAQAKNTNIRIIGVKYKYSLFEEKDCDLSWNTWLPATSEQVKWL